MPDQIRIVAAQNTGNPVLDSLVNLAAANQLPLDKLSEWHAALLKLAEQEPGGLRRAADLKLSRAAESPASRPPRTTVRSR